MAMLKKIFNDLYRSIPGVGDFLKLNDTAAELRELGREIRDIARQIEVRAAQISAAAYSSHTASAIRLLDFELEHHPRYADSRRLLRYAFQVSSQNGEDGMIHEIFHRIGSGNRVFAEVGIGDGHENNTAFLLAQGWTGFWIDGDDSFVHTIQSRADLQGGCLKFVVSFVSKESIAGLFEGLEVPKEFDLLSLDIDQNTYYAWEGLAKFRPRVVVVEYNATIPPDVDWKVHYDPHRSWDGTNNFGASLKAFENLGRRLKYCLVGCDFLGANAFFVREDLVADLFAAPFTADNHYELPRYALLHRRGHRAALLDRTDIAAQPLSAQPSDVRVPVAEDARQVPGREFNRAAVGPDLHHD
jgi:hypothetical protein